MHINNWWCEVDQPQLWQVSKADQHLHWVTLPVADIDELSKGLPEGLLGPDPYAALALVAAARHMHDISVPRLVVQHLEGMLALAGLLGPATSTARPDRCLLPNGMSGA